MGAISRDDDNEKVLAAEQEGGEALDIKDISSKELTEVMENLAQAYQEEQNSPDDRVISETTKKGHSR